MDKPAPFGRAWGFLGFRPWPKWLALASAVLLALVDVALVALFGAFVGLGAGSALVPPATSATALATLFGWALGLVVGRQTAWLFLQLAAGRAVEDAGTRLRRAIYHHTARLRDEPDAAGGESAVCETERVVDGLRWTLAHALPALCRLALLVALTLTVDFWLALAGLAAGLTLLLLGGPVLGWYEKHAQVASDKAARLLALFGEAFSRARLVKAFRMEADRQGRVENALADHADAERAAGRRRALGRFLLALLGGLIATGFVYLIGWLILVGSLSPGGAATLGGAFVGIYRSLTELWAGRDRWRQSREAAAVVFRFLDRPGTGPTSGTEQLARLTRRIEFDGVSLARPDGRPLLRELTLTLPVGQRFALVGTDDSEKRAFVALLLRFVDPSAGEVRFDQHNLRAVSLASLRGQVGVVWRDELLFTATVADNIRCGDPVELPAIIEAAKRTHAHHFVQKLPQGYETIIGPQGQPLGVGEAFRLALARAIVRDPSVLIIEEPAAGTLDADTEALLEDTLTRILPGRTAILLPQRETTLRTCSEVLLLHRGQVEARGTHQELLAGNELYQHLYYREFNIFAGRV